MQRRVGRLSGASGLQALVLHILAACCGLDLRWELGGQEVSNRDCLLSWAWHCHTPGLANALAVSRVRSRLWGAKGEGLLPSGSENMVGTRAVTQCRIPYVAGSSPAAPL